MKKLFKFLIIVIMAAFICNFMPTDYYLIKPGSVQGLGSMIAVDGESRDEDGEFYMVTVSQQSASFLLYIYGKINSIAELRPITEIMPPDMTMEEYNDLMDSWMQESKDLAKVIAMRRAGYEVPIVSDGVGVVELIPGSPAEDILLPGDIIKSVDGRTVYLAEELVALIQDKEVGEEVNLEVLRDGVSEELSVPTAPHTDNPQKAALMIYVSTVNWHPIISLDIEIDTGPVIGPSAGMMFVLELLDRLLPENLTGGVNIAGTGTISLNGKVGEIGGVKQKVAAAEMAGMEYFLVPAGNYEEALEGARKIQVVPVETLDDALNFLKSRI